MNTILRTGALLAMFFLQGATIKEFPLPRPGAFPHDVAVAKDGSVWYTDQHNSFIGHLDPATGKVVEYPYPHVDSMRDFFLDEAGRMWFGSPANDKIGYFYVAK